MNILITGNEGFIGSHLTPYLVGRGHKVVGWDLKSGKDIFELEDADLHGVDVVVHLAAKTSVPESFNQKDVYARVNILGTAKVCELVKRHRVKLIYSSTASVYSRELSPYAATKAIADDMVSYLADSMPVTLFRFYNIYGTDINSRTGSVMWQFLDGVHKGEITIWGDGEQTRDFVHISDVLEIISTAVEDQSGAWNGKVVDVGTGESYSMNYLAGIFKQYAKELYHRDVAIKYMEPKREIKWSKSDIRVLRSLYAKPFMVDLRRGVKEVFDYNQKV